MVIVLTLSPDVTGGTDKAKPLGSEVLGRHAESVKKVTELRVTIPVGKHSELDHEISADGDRDSVTELMTTSYILKA